MKIPALSKRVAVMANFAMLFYSTIRRRLQVVTPDGQVLDVEHTARQGVAGGYPGLNGDGYVFTAQLGSGATGAGTRFLADDYTWKAGGGGGVSAHPDLTSLGWTASGHTGTANRIAGFDGSNAAMYYTGAAIVGMAATHAGDLLYGDGAGGASRLPIGAANRMLLSSGSAPSWASPSDVRTALSLVVGTNVQAWDADLDGLAALGNGLPIRSAGTWTTGTVSAPLTLTGSTLAVSAASTTAAGVVELATDGETASGVVVQGNDSRLASPGAAAIGLVTWVGSGAGGNFTLDGSTAPSWGSWSTIGGVRTLTVTAAVTLEYNTFTFDFTSYSSIALVAKGAKGVVRSIVFSGTGTGYIDWNGGDASGTTGGLGAAAVSSAAPLAGGQNGSTGRATTGSGTTPTAYSQGVCLGGIGGAGGAAGGNLGGSAGSLTRDYTPGASTYGSLTDFALKGGGSNWASGTSSNDYQLSGGAGGASGGCQITATSGGGGGGGGAQIWLVGSINTGANTLYVRSRGGNGAAGVATSGGGTAGGGGGGGGGAVILIVGSVTGTVVLQAIGGNGGNGATVDADVGAGGAGGNGGLVACIYGSGTAPTGSAAGGTGGTGSGGVVASSGATGTVHIVSAIL